MKTVAVAILTSPVLIAVPVQELADEKPFLLGIIVAILAVLVGRYRGLRLTEFLRFQPVFERSRS